MPGVAVDISLLVAAVQFGKQKIIEKILQKGVEINEPQSSGETAIVESKDGAVAQFLISRGADVNLVTDSTQRTPLMHVVNKLQNQELISATTSNDGFQEVISVLLENGACVHAKTCDGRTPLMLAAAIEGQAEILQMLLDHGADCADRDKNGNTVLIHAIIAECSDNASFLIQLMKNNPDLLNVQNNRGLTALMYAVFYYRSDIAPELIDNGADVNITDVNGNTALFHAVSSYVPCSILDSLIRAGCNINHQNNAGLSPLMLAVQFRRYGEITLLLDWGADINILNHKDTSKTALAYLKAYRDWEFICCLEEFLDRGANASYLSPSVLPSIISEDNHAVIPKLVRCGLAPFDYNFVKIPISLTDREFTLASGSPLCFALLKGNATLARYIWENLFLTKSDLSLASNYNVRQLFQEIGYEECLKFLDEKGSQPMSLFMMCFVAVSSAVGASPGRDARVHQLPIPSLLKDVLLFKSEVVNLAQPQDNAGMYSALHILHHYNDDSLYESSSDDEYLKDVKDFREQYSD